MTAVVIVPIVPIVRGHYLSTGDILAAAGVGVLAALAALAVAGVVVWRLTR